MMHASSIHPLAGQDGLPGLHSQAANKILEDTAWIMGTGILQHNA